MDLHATYPGLADLKRRAQRRLPRFVWEYLMSGTGSERTTTRNRTALDRLGMMPAILHGVTAPETAATFLGRPLSAPIGIAPVGMSGLIWPDAEGHLARTAARLGIPYTLGNLAAQSPEDVAPHLGAEAWFQLYPPKDVEIRRDMLARVKAAGFGTLVLTADVPVASRRERQVRSGLTQPPRLTPRLLAQVALRPAWAWGMARRGMPRMRMLDAYTDQGARNLPPTAHVGYLMRTSPDWDYLHWLREAWDGPLIVKGVLRAEDCAALAAAGVDALWVSNHAGRQFDGAPAAIECLPAIRAATDLPLVFDSGIEGGLDILRALALGADLVMLGRAWHVALAALGADGPQHLYDILIKDMVANMGQIGAPDLAHLPPVFDLDASGAGQSPLAR